ncbi:MAG: hypothetical protein ABEJ23_02125 [Haloarculaceae archaeon]
MALYALDDLDDALDATRALLTPVDRTTWVKLALVVLFVGGPGANLNFFQYTAGDGGAPPGGMGAPELGPRAWLLVATVVGVVLLLALAFALVCAVMEFVFVESLRAEEVTIRRYWGRRWRQGVRLFGFRLVVGAFVLGSVLLLAAPFLLPLVEGGSVGGLSVATFLALLPLVVVLAVVAGLVNGFTTVFVVPVMVLEDCGVLAGWRQLWPTIRRQWEQYLAYVVAAFFLTLVGGLVVGVATAVLALVLLVPFGILFALGIGLTAVAGGVGVALLVLGGVLYGLSVLAVAALVQVPVQTYLRYYALFVLGDVEPVFDLIADRRAAVREDASA